MSEALIYLDPDSGLSLQGQIRQRLVDGIVQGAFPPGSKLPSSRKLAEQLGVARNTVVLAYEQLIEEQLLESRARSGIFVASELDSGRVGFDGQPAGAAGISERWRQRIRLHAVPDTGFRWPSNWQEYPYPFIDGHFEASLYPTAQWREASRLALGSRLAYEDSVTGGEADDPELIKQIRTKMLPRRGITAAADEILITVGKQNALYLLTRLLADRQTRVAMEEPGSPAMWQLLQQSGARVTGQPIDECGMVINSALEAAHLMYVTPSHQVPTAVTMPNTRREALLHQAAQRNQLIIEDDFEHENNYLGQPHPALRGMDRENRVIYVSGLPRVLSPGLRIGFIVAAPELIREARKLRQLVVGRPSIINQRTAAQFLALGHYEAFMTRLHRTMGERWDALRQALNHYHRGAEITLPTSGGTALWVQSPEHIPVDRLVSEAARRGILIEPDTHYYGGKRSSRNFFRMGVTGIPEERIRAGVAELERLILDLFGDRLEHLAADDPQRLDGSALEHLLPGAVIHYKTFYGVPCTIELHPDGRMSGRAGHANEDVDRGRWWVEDDLYCRQWENWGYGEVSKLQVTLKGQLIRWWRPANGRLVDAAIIDTPSARLDS